MKENILQLIPQKNKSHKRLYGNKLKNIEEMDKSVEIYNHIKTES